MAQSNLWLNRRHRFNHALLPMLREKVLAESPEMLLLSGDVTTSSLESEFEDFMDFARPMVGHAEGEAGIPGVLVPGNHDRYTYKSRRVKRIEQLLSTVMPSAFPHVRELRPGWRLLALDSAIPNKVFSRGALGRTQFAAAVETIEQTPKDAALLVLCHYPCTLPPRVPSAWSHDLKEDAKLRRALEACPGRVVYVHGHIHKPWHALPQVVDDADQSLPVSKVRSGLKFGGKAKPVFECINAGSPCMTSVQYPLGQGFWEIDLPDDPHAPIASTHHIPLPVASEDVPPAPSNGLTIPPDGKAGKLLPASRLMENGVRWTTGPAV